MASSLSKQVADDQASWNRFHRILVKMTRLGEKRLKSCHDLRNVFRTCRGADHQIDSRFADFLRTVSSLDRRARSDGLAPGVSIENQVAVVETLNQILQGRNVGADVASARREVRRNESAAPGLPTRNMSVEISATFFLKRALCLTGNLRDRCGLSDSGRTDEHADDSCPLPEARPVDRRRSCPPEDGERGPAVSPGDGLPRDAAVTSLSARSGSIPWLTSSP